MFTIGRFTLTPDEVIRRKAYLEITPQDERRLLEAHPHLVRHSGRIIDAFYVYLMGHEHTRRMLTQPGLVERLKKLQADYFRELTSGDYGMGYFEKRLRVGAAHDRVGLAPEWYLGAYAKYLQIVSGVLREVYADDHERFDLTLVALKKIIYLDMSLAIDAYIHSAQVRLESKNVELEAANTELQKLHATKQQLTDMIVHDLQNPLTGIRSFLELLGSRAEGLTPREKEAHAEALRRCDDLGQMILNVLQVSRAEAGKLEAYIENVDLAELVRESVKAFELPAELDGRKVSAEAPEKLPVRTDQSLMKRVLHNLLRNSLRHTPRGTVVRVVARAGNHGAVEIRVSDDGPGIPREAQPLLFERFGAPALRDAGLRVDSGLGLACCKSALQVLGGSIAVESDGKTGTTFKVTLP
ncbi:MAG: hypothetical protein HYY18_09720 [Planctomycetes bacterium]|nr:hypothetical protein [Planctomycetota bacterium]